MTSPFHFVTATRTHAFFLTNAVSTATNVFGCEALIVGTESAEMQILARLHSRTLHVMLYLLKPSFLI